MGTFGQEKKEEKYDILKLFYTTSDNFVILTLVGYRAQNANDDNNEENEHNETA